MKQKMVVSMCALACGFVVGSVEPQIDEMSSTITFTVAEGTETYTEAITGERITVIKDGNGSLTLTGANTFTGELRVKAGTLTASTTAHSGKPALVVENGATFISAGGGSQWGTFPLSSITLEGSGVGGVGAFVRQSGTAVRNSVQPPFILTGDATVNFAINHNPGAVSLNGYTLTKKGNGRWDAYNTGVVSASLNREGAYGKIVIAEGGLQVEQKTITIGDANNELSFLGGTFYMYPIAWSPKCPWQLKIEGTTTFNAMSDKVDNKAAIWMSGPVEISGGTLTLKHSKANATWNFQGPVTATGGHGITAVSGITLFHGDVDLGEGMYTTVKSDSSLPDARVEFLGDFKSTATADKSFLPRKGLTRFSGGKSVSIASVIGDASDKFDSDGGATGRVEVVDVDWFSHPRSTYLSGTLDIPQTLHISNSVWSGKGKILVGNNYSYGRLEMFDSVVTNRICVGGVASDQWGGSYGAIRQKGGVFSVPADTDLLQFGGAYGNSQGYYEKSGGELVFSSELWLGCYGYGAMYFNGGKAKFDKKVTLAYGYKADKNSSGAGVLYLTGGTTNTFSEMMVFGSSSVTNGSALIALEGKGTYLRTEMLYHRARCPSKTVLAVNGGAKFSAGKCCRYDDLPMEEDAEWHFSVDGGCLETGWVNEWWGTENQLPNSVTVHEGGMILRTPTADGTFVWKAPLLAPTGKVVSAISLPESEEFIASSQGLYLAPPLVAIEGSGKGAAAIALYDWETRRLTGIKVVAPGSGYGEDTKAYIGNAKGTRRVFECAVTLVDAPTAGEGFTKEGTSAYSFDVANTYRGPTVVAGGKLVLNNAAGLPAGSSLCVKAGAVADLKKHNVEVPGLSGAGLVTVGGSLTVTDTLTLPAKAGEKLTVNGPLTLADGAKIVFDGDLEGFDEAISTPVLSAATLVCTDMIQLPELPYPWKVNVGSYGISVRRIVGTVVVFR